MFYRTVENRRTSLLDRVLAEVQQAVSVLSGTVTAERKSPGVVWQQQQLEDKQTIPELNVAEAQHAAGLMRINHVGEVCAQALYRGQAVFCRQETVRATLLQAAQEEVDHLVWCADRVQELKSHTSYLNPLWYLGAYSMGVFAGAIGDKVSLGFMAETERQVEAHLEGHLNSLPAHDEVSRKIVDQMRLDEIEHRTTAQSMGGMVLPSPIRIAMQGCAKVMTTIAYRW